MSMMQLLGAFAKNLLDDNDKSMTGKQSNSILDSQKQINSRRDMDRRRYPIGQQVLIEDDEGNVRPLTVLPRPSNWTRGTHFQPFTEDRRKTMRNSDVARIANKVTRSVANHIDRMVKKRALGNDTNNMLAYNAPLNYGNSPFHNVNNPFWSVKRHSITPSRKFLKKTSYCPSCLRTYSSKAKRSVKSKKSEKLKEIKTSKKVDDEKRKTVKKASLIGMQRPVVTAGSSVNLVQKPKTIWAKELLQEFHEQAVSGEQFLNTKERVNKEETPKEIHSERVEVIKKPAMSKTKKVKKVVDK